MSQIETTIKDIQAMVFEYRLSELNTHIQKMIGELSTIIGSMDNNQILLLNQILNLINTAIGNKDYLLLADVLEYELIPFLNADMVPGGTN